MRMTDSSKIVCYHNLLRDCSYFLQMRTSNGQSQTQAYQVTAEDISCVSKWTQERLSTLYILENAHQVLAMDRSERRFPPSCA